jgi:hypothetical protein
MAHLYLPAEHTETDLIVAGQIAELIDSSELYVVWTEAEGRALPEIAAELRAPARHRTGTLAVLFYAAREFWTAFFTRRPQRAAPPSAPPTRETAA